MDILQNEMQTLINSFVTVHWTLNLIVGWSLIVLVLVFYLGFRYFAGILKLKWTLNQALGENSQESSETRIRKFFFPLFTRDPNDEFKPYIFIWTPMALGMFATLIAGFFISATDNIQNIFIGVVLLTVVLVGCAYLARWQKRHNSW
jgi:hypothetical protein